MDWLEAANEIAHKLDGPEFSTRVIRVDGGCEVLVTGEVNGEIRIRPDNSESGFAVDFIFVNGGIELIRSRLGIEETPFLGGEINVF